jgi:G3E family GTPase
VIPLIVIVGFLGAGKTTALREAVRGAIHSGKRPWVLLNDLQNAKVDAALVQEITQDVGTLDGACVCCDDPMSLIDALAKIQAKPGDVVFLEVNGSTDSWRLLELLASAPDLKHLRPLQLAGVVDGTRWQKRAWANLLEQEQIKPATWLYLSRQDQLSAPQQLMMAQALRELCPYGVIKHPRGWAVESEHLATNQGQQRKKLSPGIKPNFRKGSSQDGSKGMSGRWSHSQHAEHAHHLSHKVSAQSWNLDPNWTREDVNAWIQTLPSQVLRVKGILCSEDRWWFLQWVPESAPTWEKGPSFEHLPDLKPLVIAIGAAWDPSGYAPQIHPLALS